MSLSGFFQFLTHYTLLAALPVFVVQSLHLGGTQAGLTLTCFQAGAVLFRPLAGRWMDGYDRRKVLLYSLGLFCIVCFLYFGAWSILFLFLVRFCHGAVFSAGTTAAATMVAEFSPPSRLGEGVGYLAVFSSVAMVVGPFTGLLLIADFSAWHLFAVCTVFGCLSFLFGNAGRLPRQTDSREGGLRKIVSWRSLCEPNALPVALCGVMLAFIYSSLLGYLPLYAQKLGLLDMAAYFYAVYAAVIIVTRPLIGKLFDRIGARPVVYASLAAYGLGLAMLGRVESPAGLLAAGAVIGLGFGGANPSLQAMAVLAAPAPQRGLATATYFLAMDVGIGVGSFVLGAALQIVDFQTLYSGCALMVLLIALRFRALGRS